MSPATQKKVVLITGSNQGIGYGTALALAQESPEYHVIVTGRTLEKAQKAVETLSSSVKSDQFTALELDVSSEASIASAVKTIEQNFNHLDVLINNAGIGGWESDSLAKKCLDTYTTNTVGAYLLTEALKPLLLKSSDARILFISSGLGSIGLYIEGEHPYCNIPPGAYRMSKAAMNMVAAGFHHTLKEQGVKVWAVCPGFVHTNLRRDTERRPGTVDVEESAEFLKDVVVGKRDGDAGLFVHKDGVYPW